MREREELTSYETPTIETYSEAVLREQFGEVAALSVHDDTYSDTV